MVGIKDAKMPKSCMFCQFHDQMYNRCDVGFFDTNAKFIKGDDAWSFKHPNCPLVETEERKVGKWIYDKTIQNWRCSECNETPKTLGYVGTADFMAEHFRFCNHCGADMRGAEECPEPLKLIDKVKEEIERQRTWLFKAGYNAYNIDIAFDAIKSLLKEGQE